VRLAKRLLGESRRSRLNTLLETATAFQALSHQNADHREAVAAFLEKRPAVFAKPHKKPRLEAGRQSPISLTCSLRSK
jgi:hypothetical protein